MPPKKNQNPSKTRNQSNEPLPDAMGECVFPEEIMRCILTRLPVKSLLRFKSVCKPWLKLLASPYFIKSHYHQFSSDSQNQNFMICSSETSLYYGHTMSLFKIESDEKKATNLNHPYLEISNMMNFVGCCNGLVCVRMDFARLRDGVVLWNPAMQLCKLIRFSKPECTDGLSLGFGYDEEGDDFKVLKIDCLRVDETKVGVEVYSTKSGSWKTIKVDLQFRVEYSKTNDAIVGGNPYWVAKDVSSESQIVWFDVKKMVFKIVPLNHELGNLITFLPLMDWKGCVATILSCHGSLRVEAFEKDAKKWKTVQILGPMELKVYRCLQCSKSGKVIGVCSDGKLFVFDPKSGGVKVFEVEKAPRMLSLEIHEYNESLRLIEGMEAVTVKKTGEEKELAVEVVGLANRMRSCLEFLMLGCWLCWVFGIWWYLAFYSTT